jgi:dienelactone hydrolase
MDPVVPGLQRDRGANHGWRALRPVVAQLTPRRRSKVSSLLRGGPRDRQREACPRLSCTVVTTLTVRGGRTARRPGPDADDRGLRADAPGEPRLKIDPGDQIRDCQHAITYAQGRPDVDVSRIGVWGLELLGGNAFAVAAIDRRVKAVRSSWVFRTCGWP